MWNNELQVVQVRIARPTDQLDKVKEFYMEGLGLEVVGHFENHQGYDGLMIGLPVKDYHLEFTQFVEGSPCPEPTHDNLLVFYIPDEKQIEVLITCLTGMGYPEVEPENPYWLEKGKTIEDPDGWRIVLINTKDI